MSEKITHTVGDGKYTIIYEDGRLSALRYGEPWRDLVGDGMVLAMLQEINFLKEQREIDNLQITSLLSEVDHLSREVDLLTVRNKLLSRNTFGQFIFD
ncbi:MAG: hypothetical protein CTY12_01415 [Methylotenera sp.]|nr:MAG: hypothetical protein CTY12_01415 [Methylotenera sp.]